MGHPEASGCWASGDMRQALEPPRDGNDLKDTDIQRFGKVVILSDFQRFVRIKTDVDHQTTILDEKMSLERG